MEWILGYNTHMLTAILFKRCLLCMFKVGVHLHHCKLIRNVCTCAAVCNDSFNIDRTVRNKQETVAQLMTKIIMNTDCGQTPTCGVVLMLYSDLENMSQ